ncbi:MAG: hypothetical protein HY537_09175 [Deltaproteobacteria bacterium]|nr:hypothetical protein [Deltaproteobacteria bacterium]
MKVADISICILLALMLPGCFTDTQSVKGTFVQLESPVVSLKEMPSMIRGNAVYQLQLYAAAAEALSIRRLRLQISFSNGPFSDVTEIEGNPADYLWNTPAVDSKNVRLKLIAEDTMGKLSETLSDPFEIRTRGPYFSQELVSNTLINQQNAVTYGGTCESDYPITLKATSGNSSQTVKLTCANGIWNYSIAETQDGERLYEFIQTDPVGNKSIVNALWIRDTAAPTITSFSGPSKSVTNYVPFSMEISDLLTNVTDFCLKHTTDPSVSMEPDNNCWTRVDQPDQPNVPLAKIVKINSFYYRIGFSPALFRVQLYVRDQAGNTTSSPLTAEVNYLPGQPPVVANVLVANVDNPHVPPTRSELIFAAGDPVYIRWSASSSTTGLISNPISLYYTLNDSTYQPIAESLPNSANSGCSADPNLYTGCYVWATPTSGFFRIRVAAKDTNGTVTYGLSNFLNSGVLQGIAGNTDPGLGSSATAALFFNSASGFTAGDPQSFVITVDGRLYFRDANRGILWVSPIDGVQKMFIPTTEVQTGDGGPASQATLKAPLKITLDYRNRLLIFDYDRIRAVDFSTGLITTILGGGNSTGDNVGPFDVKFTPLTTNTEHSTSRKQMPLIALPNGDIVFQSDEYFTKGARTRWYQAAQGKVISIRPYGTGSAYDANEDIVNCSTQVVNTTVSCRLMNFAAAFNPITSQFTALQVGVWHQFVGSWGDYPANLITSGSEIGKASAPIPPRPEAYSHFVSGRNGNIYSINRYRPRVRRFDIATNTWIPILGNNTVGTCEDGTLATDCAMEIFDFFADASHVYFIDRGRIRTLDDQGRVVTLFGQPFHFGDGKLAISARLNIVTTIDVDKNGVIFLIDQKEYRIRKFTVGGLMNAVAGNGTNSTPNTTDPATQQPLLAQKAGTAFDYMRVNPETGAIFFNRGESKIAMLDSSGRWQDLKA